MVLRSGLHAWAHGVELRQWLLPARLKPPSAWSWFWASLTSDSKNSPNLDMLWTSVNHLLFVGWTPRLLTTNVQQHQIPQEFKSQEMASFPTKTGEASQTSSGAHPGESMSNHPCFSDVFWGPKEHIPQNPTNKRWVTEMIYQFLRNSEESNHNQQKKTHGVITTTWGPRVRDKNYPADSLPPRDSAKNIVWSWSLP